MAGISDALRRTYPRPLATALTEVERERDPLKKYIRLFELADEALKYLTLVALSRYLELRGEGDSKVEQALAPLRRPNMGDWTTMLRALHDFMRCRQEPLFGADLDEKRHYPGMRDLMRVTESMGLRPTQAKTRNKVSPLMFLADLVALRNTTKGHGTSPDDEKLSGALSDALVEFLDTCHALLVERPLVFIQEIRFLKQKQFEVVYLPLIGTERPVPRTNDRVDDPGILVRGQLFLWNDQSGPAPLQLTPFMHYDSKLDAVFMLSGLKGDEPEYKSSGQRSQLHHPDRLIEAFRERAPFLLKLPGPISTGARPAAALDAYEIMIREGLSDGGITSEAWSMLSAARRGLGLADEEVEFIHERLGMEGEGPTQCTPSSRSKRGAATVRTVSEPPDCFRRVSGQLRRELSSGTPSSPASFDRILVLADRLVASCAATPEWRSIPGMIQELLRAAMDAADKHRYEQPLALWRDMTRKLGERAEEVANPDGTARGTLRAMLGLVAANYDPLHSALRGLVTAPWAPATDSDLTMLARRIELERQRHLDGFVGRVGVLDGLTDIIEGAVRAQGGYLLLIGPAGRGKSAVATQLCSRLGRSPVLCGEGVDVWPWLPGTLLHHGKAERSAKLIVASLVHQANMLLLDPVHLPQPHAGQDSMSAEVHETHWAGIGPDDFDSDCEGASAAMMDGQEGASSEDDRIRSALIAALERLVLERGEATIVIDALDEISRDGSSLGFLPDVLPPGAVVILTSRPERPLLDMLARRGLRPHGVALEGLTLEEVAALTQVPDPEWNRSVHRHSGGEPLAVRGVVQQLHSCDDDYRRVDPRAEPTSILRGQVAQWLNTGPKRDRHLGLVLRFLATMEPVAPVPLGAIQGFLEARGFQVSRAELSAQLDSLSSQLQGVPEVGVKLGAEVFAEFVRQQVLGPRDLARFLESIAGWLATDEYVDPGLCASFLLTWCDSKGVSDKSQRAGAEKLIVDLAATEMGDRLYHIFEAGVPGGQPDPPVFRSALQSAAALGQAGAAFRLGLRLFRGIGGNADVEEGGRWLRRAADLGHATAMRFLAECLFEGRVLQANAEEGERWLRKAAEEGDAPAMRVLAQRLFDGRGLQANAEEGERWLRKAAEAGYARAMLFLAQRLFEGRGLQANAEEAERWLRKAVEAGDIQSMRSLGIRALDGDGVRQDFEEGARWLRKAAEAGDAPAMRVLAQRLFDGRGLQANAEEGESWLRKAADAGDTQSIGILGARLLGGRGVSKDLQQGARWLRKAADAGDARVMRFLAQRLFEGRGLQANAEEAERWLRKAAEAGDIQAMRIIGIRALDGDGVRQDFEEGARWLRKAAEAGDATAMGFLAQRLFEGRGLQANAEEAERWLHRAADAGDADSVGVLAAREPEVQGLTESVGMPPQELIEHTNPHSVSSHPAPTDVGDIDLTSS